MPNPHRQAVDNPVNHLHVVFHFETGNFCQKIVVKVSTKNTSFNLNATGSKPARSIKKYSHDNSDDLIVAEKHYNTALHILQTQIQTIYPLVRKKSEMKSVRGLIFIYTFIIFSSLSTKKIVLIIYNVHKTGFITTHTLII